MSLSEPGVGEPVFTVIIPTHNRVDALVLLLKDLELQTLPREQFEVIVVDDASPVDPTETLKALPLSYTLEVMRVEKGGPAKARNRALARARGKWVLFLNDDIRASQNLLTQHALAHRTQASSVAVLGAFAFSDELRKNALNRVLEDLGVVITTRHFKSGEMYGYQAFWTGNLSLSRALLESVGGFDERFPDPSHEDIELGIRLERLKNVHVLYLASASCSHEHPMEVEHWRRQKRMGGRNAWTVHQLHRVLSLGALERDGEPDRAAMEQWWSTYLQQGPGMAQLAGIVHRLSSGSAFPFQSVRFNGQEYGLPMQREAFMRDTLNVLDQQEQLAGIVSAALGYSNDVFRAVPQAVV